MAEKNKSDAILDAVQQLLNEKDINQISVSEIAERAGIGKGSIYYYFPSKNAILDTLIRRSYERPLHTAKNLSTNTNVSSYTRMAMLFQACRSSSNLFLNNTKKAEDTANERSLLHQKHINYLVSELKPVLTEIIKQGISCGEIEFDYPEALAEIVLIVLAIKLDNYIIPTSAEDTEKTLRGLISLLEKGTGVPKGVLEYLAIKDE